jgi:3-oxoacyl-[acyl-carrier-protein] synthase-1
MREPLAIVRVGVFCPVGLDAEQTAASILAGLPRKQETSFRSEEGDRIVMGHMPAEVLPPLVPELEHAEPPPTPRVARLLRLAAPALQEVLGVADGASPGPPLFVVGPQATSNEPAPMTGAFLEQLVRQARTPVALAASKLFPLGHAGLFAALHEANARLLAPGAAEFVVVGGVDSYFDAERLGGLEREGRLLTSGLQDALTPGEGAAFLLIASQRACQRYGLEPLAWIPAIGLAMEAGHRYASAPHRGDGLAEAFGQVFGALGNRAPPVRLVMAALNGETFHAKEWGVACVRHRESFADPLRLEHPAEYTGDAGAALAPIMLAVAALELKAKNLEGPALVWAASDRAERGALLVQAP